MKMKELFTLLLFSIGLFSLNAQSIEEQHDELAKYVCQCVNAKEFDKLDGNQITLQVGNCFAQALADEPDLLENLLDGKPYTQKNLQEIGRTTGGHMLKYCPEFFIHVVQNLDSIPMYREIEEEKAEEFYLTEIGEITSIEFNQFTTVNLQTEDGSTLKFQWLMDFENSEILINEQYKNKEVLIIYDNLPFYNLNEKAYINYKVIFGIQLEE